MIKIIIKQEDICLRTNLYQFLVTKIVIILTVN